MDHPYRSVGTGALIPLIQYDLKQVLLTIHTKDEKVRTRTIRGEFRCSAVANNIVYVEKKFASHLKTDMEVLEYYLDTHTKNMHDVLIAAYTRGYLMVDNNIIVIWNNILEITYEEQPYVVNVVVK